MLGHLGADLQPLDHNVKGLARMEAGIDVLDIGGDAIHNVIARDDLRMPERASRIKAARAEEEQAKELAKK